MGPMVSDPDCRVVVIGAGHAGGTLAGLLRSSGHRGTILMLGEERHLPYHRPPLSKSFGSGDHEDWLRHPDFYGEQDIDVRVDDPASRIDVDAKQVTTASDNKHSYDVLVLATGARPRALRIPGGELLGIGKLRTLDDAMVLRTWLTERRRILIIGGGYIGLEVAAVLRSHGSHVTILEREHRILARVASTEFSAIIASHHVNAGTRIVTDAEVVAFEGDGNGRVIGARLSDGTVEACDAVLVGVGAIPNDELARDAGIACAANGGVLVDAQCRTSDPHVLAIGDVTVRPVPGVDHVRRLESIPSATEQARQALAVILGLDQPVPEIPWFWSDQFDLKLKIAGVLGSRAQSVLRGDPSSGRFALYHLRDQGVIAVESSNAPPEFMAGRKWIGMGTRVDPVLLRNPSVPLREVTA